MEKIWIDEKICVRCGACVSESEFGGVKFLGGKIFVDETKPEDWTAIISICPTGAIQLLVNKKKKDCEKYFLDNPINDWNQAR